MTTRRRLRWQARSLTAVLGLVVSGTTGACDKPDNKAKPPPASSSRVNAVQAKPEAKADLKGFCDTLAAADQAKPFAMPQLDGPAPSTAGGWQWVNVWATWCKPCIEELPMLAGWRKRMADDRLGAELVFLSVDDSAETVATYRKQHPNTPEGPRIKDATGLAPWLQTLGLGESSVLPIHMFVDPQGKLRCVRMGPVSERDYETVKALLRQG